MRATMRAARGNSGPIRARASALRRTLLLALLVLCGRPAQAFDEPENWARVLLGEFQAGRPLPNITRLWPDIDPASALQIQTVFVRELGAGLPRLGYQAALLGFPEQQRFRLRQGVTGVLFGGIEREPGAVIDSGRGDGLMVEVEIGYVMRQAIDRPLAPDADPGALIAAVQPVVEFADLDFEEPGAVRGAEFVSANLLPRHLIRAAPLHEPTPAAANAVFVELQRDNTVVDFGKGSNVLGDQAAALRWLVNAVLARGWRIEAGDLLLTGTVGTSVHALPGDYLLRLRTLGAEGADLGELRFSVRRGAARE